MRVFDHLGTMDDVYNEAINELAEEDIHIDKDVAKDMIKSREATMLRGMKEGRNIKFRLLGVVTISLGKFQRANIKRKLKAQYKTKEALNEAVDKEMKNLGKKDELMANDLTAITKNIKLKFRPTFDG